MATVGACAGFAAVSGSSLATAATMGTVALPEMKKYSYHPALALIQQIVEPVMAPARKLIPPLGGLDLSPMLVILVLLIIESALPQLFMSLLL